MLFKTLCFVHIFLLLVCYTIATSIENFFQACGEEMLKTLVILTLLMIINRYQWYNKFDKKVLTYDVNKQLHWK